MAYHISERGSKVRAAVQGGSSVFIDIGGEIEYVEVMKNPRWRKANHYQFPRNFQEIVKLLLLARKQTDCRLHILPEGIFFQIVEEISVAYEAKTPLSSTVNPIKPREPGQPASGNHSDSDDE
jgi:hypothetical protein